MKSLFLITVLLQVAAIISADNCVPKFYQCGGKLWKGSKCCNPGLQCVRVNDLFSYCGPQSNNSNLEYNSNYSTNINNNSNNNNVSNNINYNTNDLNNNSNNLNNNSNNVNNNINNNVNGSNDNINNNNTNSNISTPVPNVSSELIGYATMNGGTVGGQGGQTISVSNQSEFTSAVKGDNAKIVVVNGIIKLSSDVKVGSNTSIIGANKNSGFTGAGLKINHAKNIIIQNLKFSYCVGSTKDCINVTFSNNIWIDHCELFNDRNHGKDYYDGLIDITHACDYITVSWCYLHDHYKASLVGHSDNNGNEDTGKLHVTYHHNYFKNIGSRLPSLRFGTGHIFNNVYESIDTSSVNIRMGAKALVEGNVFRNGKRPISTNLDSKKEGSVIQRNNDFGNTANTNSITRTDGLSSVPYQYTSENTNSVYNNVKSKAGPK